MKSHKRQFIEKYRACRYYEDAFDDLEKELLEAIEKDSWVNANLEWPKKSGPYLCRFDEVMDIYEVAYWNKEREMWEFEGTYFNCNFYSHWQSIKPPQP